MVADGALAPQAGSTADDGRAPLMPAAVAAALARAAAAIDTAEAPDKTHDETVAELDRAASLARVSLGGFYGVRNGPHPRPQFY